MFRIEANNPYFNYKHLRNYVNDKDSTLLHIINIWDKLFSDPEKRHDHEICYFNKKIQDVPWHIHLKQSFCQHMNTIKVQRPEKIKGLQYLMVFHLEYVKGINIIEDMRTLRLNFKRYGNSFRSKPK